MPVTDNSLKSIADRCEKQVGRTDRQRIHAESIPEKESSVKDDSSWCDLTDTSQTSISIMASGDNGKSPPKVQEKVKQFNCISKTLEHPEIPDQNKEPRKITIIIIILLIRNIPCVHHSISGTCVQRYVLFLLFFLFLTGIYVITFLQIQYTFCQI